MTLSSSWEIRLCTPLVASTRVQCTAAQLTPDTSGSDGRCVWSPLTFFPSYWELGGVGRDAVGQFDLAVIKIQVLSRRLCVHLQVFRVAFCSALDRHATSSPSAFPDSSHTFGCALRLLDWPGTDWPTMTLTDHLAETKKKKEKKRWTPWVGCSLLRR